MRNLEEIISLVPDLNREDLDRWIQDSLIEMQQEAGHAALSDRQFARVRLICSLRFDMDVEEETLPVVLDLLDQLHATRERLYTLSQAVLAQDEEVKAAVLEALSQRKSTDGN
ncbi:MerR HTH family regulatory protein [Hoeflea sp. IMCC20628]|uniref:chaperone modulator CbpM n=1 Tax=Hoeflea sp. IMCC20628 TaxID=1620421 RepID=UPI00063AC17E|nr:chaperone modulator CbpM [Hoeflea sp. IMCC20628]AKI00231.1 MerR HTH family regulatory protein [Hoeflea sp. IMCC20628]